MEIGLAPLSQLGNFRTPDHTFGAYHRGGIIPQPLYNFRAVSTTNEIDVRILLLDERGDSWMR